MSISRTLNREILQKSCQRHTQKRFLLKSSRAVNFFQWWLHYHSDWLGKKRDKRKKRISLSLSVSLPLSLYFTGWATSKENSLVSLPRGKTVTLPVLVSLIKKLKSLCFSAFFHLKTIESFAHCSRHHFLLLAVIFIGRALMHGVWEKKNPYGSCLQPTNLTNLQTGFQIKVVYLPEIHSPEMKPQICVCERT